MSQKGILLVTMQPPPALEEEFNAWYDTEHVPERLAVPGFESGIRFVCVSGSPRYVALYDLNTVDVLDGAEYARVSGEHFSPWTRRVTSRVRVHRSAGVQILPGDAITRRTARLLLIRFAALAASDGDRVLAGARRLFDGRPEVAQTRVFSCPAKDGTEFYVAVGITDTGDRPVDTTAFGPIASAIDLINLYANY
ncbi:MAG: hypothetical protein JWR08_170 [Enterovirga sp.]|nr:hypothetical protein [Enterovirga sp.]